MAYAATANSEPSLKVPLVWSAVLHSLLLCTIVVSAFVNGRGNLWGAPGESAMSVGIVRNLPGVPLPKPDTVTASRVVDETKGLHREEPRQPEKPIPATTMPEFSKTKRPKYVSRPSKVLEDPTPPPEGAIPYGQGGTPTMPYSQFAMAGKTEGGLAFSGSGGEFGARYPWYVEAVKRRVSGNWLVSEVDTSVRWAPRVVVTFQILPDGTIANVQVLRSSGNASVDNSARRAVLGASPLERLPTGYGGSTVNVEFWFDFRR